MPKHLLSEENKSSTLNIISFFLLRIGFHFFSNKEIILPPTTPDAPIKAIFILLVIEVYLRTMF